MSSNQHKASLNVTQRGTIELADLPGNMKRLRLSPNALSGALDLDMLPGALQALSHGAVGLRTLPEHPVHLDGACAKFLQC